MLIATSWNCSLVFIRTPSQFILNFQYRLRIALFTCMKRPGNITFPNVLVDSWKIRNDSSERDVVKSSVIRVSSLLMKNIWNFSSYTNLWSWSCGMDVFTDTQPQVYLTVLTVICSSWNQNSAFVLQYSRRCLGDVVVPEGKPLWFAD
jgi:hypothetical protein